MIGTCVVSDPAINDTSSLIGYLHQRYPSLSAAQYAIAVNQNIIVKNTMLANHATVALLPPFSGG